MKYEKKTGFPSVTVIIIILVLGLATLLLFVASFFGSRYRVGTGEKASNKKTIMQPKEKKPVDKQDKDGNSTKYITMSKEGNIDILVNYMNPITGDKDTLIFEITVGTHSVDLTKYGDIRKFVELRTNGKVVNSDSFEWNRENASGHHINGILKISNNLEGKPIISADTKKFSLVFKNIGVAGERKHVYEGEKLK